MSQIEDKLLYTDSHEWVRIEDDLAYVGITDFSQKQLGEIKFIDSSEVAKQIIRGEEFGSIESTKATTDLLAPISGNIVEINKDILNSPNLINKEPYQHWILKIKISDKTEIQNLMNFEAYQLFLSN